MKKLIGLCGFLAIFAIPAMAQDIPKTELSAGYALRVFYQGSGARVGMNGWYADGDYNFSKRFGATVDLSGTYRNLGINGDTSAYTAMVGPSIYPLGHRHLTLFGRILGGEGIYLVHYPAFGGFPVKDTSNARFAWQAGGGLDLTRSPRWAIRLFELDYGQTQFQSGYGYQKNLRVSIGFVYRFGEE